MRRERSSLLHLVDESVRASVTSFSFFLIDSISGRDVSSVAEENEFLERGDPNCRVLSRFISVKRSTLYAEILGFDGACTLTSEY